MKKKICFIVASPLTIQAFLQNHIKVLAVDYDIYVVANFSEFNLEKFKNLPVQEFKNIGIQRDISFFKDIFSLFHLTKYLKSKKFDSIHTITPKAGLIGILAGKLANIQHRIHIFTGQVWFTKKGFLKKLLILLDKLIVLFSTVVLVDGNSQKDFLINQKIISNKNSFVLGKGSISGVDESRFIPNLIKRNEIRNQLKFQLNDVVFIFVGRFTFDKGLIELANAYNLISKKFNHTKLLMVGFDEQKLQPLMEKIIDNKSNLIFYGSTSEPENILQAGDIFCLPSHREGFGTSVIEASLMEKAIICSDTYGLLDTIIENKTGLRHEVNSVKSLYAKMEELVIDQDKIINFGKNGRNYVLENFTATNISNEWKKFYNQLIK